MLFHWPGMQACILPVCNMDSSNDEENKPFGNLPLQASEKVFQQERITSDAAGGGAQVFKCENIDETWRGGQIIPEKKEIPSWSPLWETFLKVFTWTRRSSFLFRFLLIRILHESHAIPGTDCKVVTLSNLSFALDHQIMTLVYVAGVLHNNCREEERILQ